LKRLSKRVGDQNFSLKFKKLPLCKNQSTCRNKSTKILRVGQKNVLEPKSMGIKKFKQVKLPQKVLKKKRIR